MARSKPTGLFRKGFLGRGAAPPGLVAGNEPRDLAPSRPLSFVGFVVFTGQKGTFPVAHPLFLLSVLWPIVSDCMLAPCKCAPKSCGAASEISPPEIGLEGRERSDSNPGVHILRR